MANLVKKELDTRTFPEICSTLTKPEWLELKCRLMKRIGKCEQTYINWKNGKTYPAGILERKAVSDVVNALLQTNTNHNTLFIID